MLGANPAIVVHPIHGGGGGGGCRNTPSRFLLEKLEWVLAWSTAWHICRLNFHRLSCLLQNEWLSKTFHMNTTWFSCEWLNRWRTFSYHAIAAQVNLRFGYSAMSCSGSLWFGVILTSKFNSKWRVKISSKAGVILTPQTELSLLHVKLFLL